MAYVTNPYSSQYGVIGSLRSVGETVRGLTDDYLRRKQQEQNMLLQQGQLSLQGAQAQATQQQTLSGIEFNIEQARAERGEAESRRLATEEYRTQQQINEAATAERLSTYRTGMLEISGKQAETAATRLERTPAPTMVNFGENVRADFLLGQNVPAEKMKFAEPFLREIFGDEGYDSMVTIGEYDTRMSNLGRIIHETPEGRAYTTAHKALKIINPTIDDWNRENIPASEINLNVADRELRQASGGMYGIAHQVVLTREYTEPIEGSYDTETGKYLFEDGKLYTVVEAKANEEFFVESEYPIEETYNYVPRSTGAEPPQNAFDIFIEQEMRKPYTGPGLETDYQSMIGGYPVGRGVGGNELERGVTPQTTDSADRQPYVPERTPETFGRGQYGEPIRVFDRPAIVLSSTDDINSDIIHKQILALSDDSKIKLPNGRIITVGELKNKLGL